MNRGPTVHDGWFTDPATRMIHPEEDRPAQSRIIAA
jgi:hypothetical protein